MASAELNAELEFERAYVQRLYERLDDARDQAKKRLDDVRILGGGGTHQARSERDAFARDYEDRLAQLRLVEDSLAFGRLDLHATDADSGAARHYIGRIGLRDSDDQLMLLDWRVPQARAFYQATAAEPLGARSRRHIRTRGREVVGIDDEVFDGSLLDEGHQELQGEAALMAALTASRTGRMHDIVATIQAEQDRIIRAPLHGALVVQGGPGTGKTAVALHRAAYLLYTHRERLGSSGVLVVGPSRAFVDYIGAVLPSLGETGVVTASLGALFPGVETALEDAPDTAALKGSRQMVRLLGRAVKSRQVVPTEDVEVEIAGERFMLPAGLVHGAIRRAWDSRRPHNQARIVFNKVAVAAIADLVAERLEARGGRVTDSDLSYLRHDVRQSYDVKVALNTAWMPLSAQKLVRDLYARPNWLASLTPRWSPEKRALLLRGRDEPFTVSDVPLLDEAAELLGDLDDHTVNSTVSEQRRRDIESAETTLREYGVEGMVDAARVVRSYEADDENLTLAERAMTDRTWTFGHIVVDEAQELSAMQWRMLVRKNPLRSFTIVGDIAQVTAPGGASSWDQALDGPLGETWRREDLTVNYRTPAQITELAERVATAAGVPITPTRSVREGTDPVLIERTSREQVAERVASLAAELSARPDGGSVAVIANANRADVDAALTARLDAAVGFGALGLQRPVARLTPTQAKGLEFDRVIVVEPAQFGDEGIHAASALYVAMTRPTHELAIVHAQRLPAGFDLPTPADGS